MLQQSISKNGLLLCVFALITAGILAGTYEGTKSTIAQAEKKAAQKALLEIIPAERIDNDILLETLPIPEKYWDMLGLTTGGDIHLARHQQKTIAVIIPAVAPDGYSGAIKLIVGVNRNGTIAGVRALSHTETPGLGDKIDTKKSDWILGFNQRSLSSPSNDNWQVKKDGGDFDQFTGATITPRAVVGQVKRVLEFVQQQQISLFPQEKTTHE